MKSAYLSINESCYMVKDGEKVDKENVKDIKEYLDGYADTSKANTMEDFEKLIRNDTITASDVSDSGAFSYRCTIYKKGVME